ncbi:MAG: ATP-binding cassette domain-containing protein [Spirochaetaceae bacterium]|nr:ATP-binding cassette domain-containing protein [Spirochaetaceae bacterium]
MAETAPLLQMRGVQKWFGKVHALRGVDLTVDSGEVVAIVGDNGAGKSTLIKILVGLIPLNDGQILWQGAPVAIRSIQDSRALGIEAVYQDQAVVDSMSVADNVFLGREPEIRFGPFRFLDRRLMLRQTESLTRRLGLSISSAEQEMRFCSGGERQGVAISRAMHHQAPLTILDEPVAALSLKGTNQVLEFIEQLKRKNTGVIVIEHNLGHAFRVADRFVIMSHGEVVADVMKKDTSLAELEATTINL